MRAMVLERPGTELGLQDVPVPVLQSQELLIQVLACGVCRTDLHLIDSELPNPRLPLIPGHEIVGRVTAVGRQAAGFKVGDRVGVAWLASACGDCSFCKRAQENLCPRARFTGYTVNGGYAEYVAADAAFCFHLPETGTDVELAPLMCAGFIGYRAYRLAGSDAARLGLYGFGAAAHILAQIAVFEGREVYAFTRPGDAAGQEFARKLGAAWAGGSDQPPPQTLDAAIIFAPTGSLVPAALAAVQPAGTVICAGIHMSDIPSFPYRLLWGERVLRSVANLTHQDGQDFLALAPAAGVRATVEAFPLEHANEALAALRAGRIEGAAVLQVASRVR